MLNMIASDEYEKNPSQSYFADDNDVTTSRDTRFGNDLKY